MEVKFGDVKINDVSKKHIIDCLNRNWLTMGSKVQEFELKWAELNNYRYVIATNSGTSANIAALLSLYYLGAEPNDEVITPSLSFIATANSIRAANFIPKFVDVRDDLQINEEQIESQITNKTIAIMPVALMGRSPKLDIIQNIARKHNLLVILDSCENHGGQYKGKLSGHYADISTYSFFSAHVIFSVEMGGACTKLPDLDLVMRSIRNHGRRGNQKRFDHQFYGLNLKPTDIHASVGLGNLDHFHHIFNKRKENFNKFYQRLSHLREFCYFLEEEPDCINSPHAFSLTVKDPKYDIKSLQRKLESNEIETKRNFGAQHTHKCFQYLGHEPEDFPISTYLGDNGIHWSCSQFLTDNQIDFICNIVEEHFKNI